MFSFDFPGFLMLPIALLYGAFVLPLADVCVKGLLVITIDGSFFRPPLHFPKAI